ncbi:SGNH/GDSL hydrolase family protein [Rubripirellula lacrimiformis]|nr:SGNH/GDSL hydrolase family protein [Rubripirellula lacrimiformis]
MKPTLTLSTALLLTQAIAICCVTSVTAKSPIAAPAKVQLTGPWTVSVTVPGQQSDSAELKIPGPEIFTVTHEKFDRLPDFDAKTTSGWRKGARLKGVIAAECTVEGLLDPTSVVVRSGPEPAAKTFQKGIDYEADLVSGTIGRLPEGAIAPDQPVYIDYQHTKQRIDSIVIDGNDRIVLKTGTPHAAMPEPPTLDAGQTRLANVYLPARMDALSADQIFPILETSYPETPASGSSVAERLLPESLKKLQSGEPLEILAWGDSVSTFNRYQTMFVESLKSRYPNANIELVTEAWGGRNTGSYLSEPPGSEHNYQDKVLNRKPDLIVSEFVNDAGLSEPQVDLRYGKILADFRKIGAEWIILTPHYVRPSWMGFSSQRNIDDDPRAYVKGVRAFAKQNQIAVAEGSLRYGRLWRQGIPYITLMENNINHPNVNGHRIFADSLIALFPKSE